MSDDTRRKKLIGMPSTEKTPLEASIDNTLAELLQGKETIRVGKKIIKTPDSETSINYELAVNPRTGQQEVIETITTNKKECARCSKYVAQVSSCRRCGMKVCGSCITSFYVSGPPENGVCKSCFEGLDKTLSAHDR